MAIILVAATLLLLVCTLLPCTRSEVWWVRGFDFPRLQLTVLLAVTLAAQFIWLDLRELWSCVVVLITLGCLLYQSWWILPYTRLVPAEVRAASAEATDTLRILAANVLMTNRKPQALLSQVSQHRPDLLIVVEGDRWWQERLDSLEDDYPYALKCPQDNLYGMHVYSRLPLVDARIQYLVSDEVPSMQFGVRLRSGVDVDVHCVHPAPPSPTENETSSERDAELILVAKAVNRCRRPVVVTGDLNDVAWSATTRLFRKISGLLDPRVGRGMYNTFHARIPFLRWPLDHLFHSDHFTLVEMCRLARIGSDHFPILVELVYTPAQRARQRGLQAGGLQADSSDRRWAAEKVEGEGENSSAVQRPEPPG